MSTDLSNTSGHSESSTSSPLSASVQRARDAVSSLYGGVLDTTYEILRKEKLETSTAHAALDRLFRVLQDLRMTSEESVWRQTITICRSHPLKGIVHQDPFTRRAFHKPRGYAGDAVMMDYIYCCEENWETPQASPLGNQIFEFTTQAPASDGVRARRAYVADVLDLLSTQRKAPRVLSVAAGHLREAGISTAVRRGKLGRYVALDADATSLDEVRKCYGRYGVETVPARFRDLLTNRVDLGSFDLVYTTGLLDYLNQSTARRLVSVLFGLLDPGGRLLVANFMPGVRDVGYMEAYMDWQLIYRTRFEMLDLIVEVPEANVGDVRLLVEENRNIVILEVTRQ